MLKNDAAERIPRIIGAHFCLLQNLTQRNILVRENVQGRLARFGEQIAKTDARINRAWDREQIDQVTDRVLQFRIKPSAERRRDDKSPLIGISINQSL